MGMYRTWKLHIGESDQLDTLASRTAELWNQICTWYWRTVRRQGHWTSKGQMRKWHVNGLEGLHSHTAKAVNDQFYEAVNSWHGNDRKGNPPYNAQKRWNVVRWKSPSIKLRDDGVLRLSNGRGEDPVLIDWPVDQEPVFVEIGWSGEGYEARATYEVDGEDRTTGDRTAGIDLGEKHLAAVATTKDCFLMNGGELRALRQYQNQAKARLQAKIDRKERGSNRWTKLARTKNRQLDHIANKIHDLLHKLSRKLVEMLLERGVSTAVVGDLKGIRDRIRGDRRMNQRFQQWAYRKFFRLFEYKARAAGMAVKQVDEEYTSQTCPSCGDRHEPAGRHFTCDCGLRAHRDVVGAINIRRKYVGADAAQPVSTRLPGAMASPSGVRFEPHLQCSSPPAEQKTSEREQPA